MNFKIFYITFPSKEEAVQVAKILLEEKLIACANIIGPIISLFAWEEKINEDQEFIMIAKTKASLEQKTIDRVKELHSYDIPCIISCDISNGNPSFLDWISNVTL